MRRASASSALFLLLATAGEARAEDKAHERAIAAFEHARKLIEVGDCAAAIPKLEESLKHEASVGAHLSFADCIEKDDPRGAFWHVREASLIAYLKHDERHSVAEARAASLVPRVAAITVQIATTDLAAPGLVVRIDGEPIDRFHLAGPLAVRPGERTISASTADGRTWTSLVAVEVGESIPVTVALVREPSPAPRAPAVEPARDALARSVEPPKASPRRTIGLAVGGAGLVTMAVGGAFGIVALTKKGELDRVCNGDSGSCTGYPPVVDPVLDSAEKNATASTILFAAGGALLVSGIVLWLTAPKSGSPGMVARW